MTIYQSGLQLLAADLSNIEASFVMKSQKLNNHAVSAFVSSLDGKIGAYYKKNRRLEKTRQRMVAASRFEEPKSILRIRALLF